MLATIFWPTIQQKIDLGENLVQVEKKFEFKRLQEFFNLAADSPRTNILFRFLKAVRVKEDRDEVQGQHAKEERDGGGGRGREGGGGGGGGGVGERDGLALSSTPLRPAFMILYHIIAYGLSS